MTIAHISTNVNQQKSAASFVTTGVSCSADDLLIVALACDNAGTNGTAPTISSINFTTNSETFNLNVTALQDPGAASDGAYLSIWTCVPTLSHTNETITIAYSAGVPTAQVVAVSKFSKNAGAITVANGTANTGTPATGSPITPTGAGQLVYGAFAAEDNTGGTADTDTTNGSWSSLFQNLTSGGSAVTNMVGGTQHKIVTASGLQNFGPIITGDSCIHTISVTESSAPFVANLPLVIRQSIKRSSTH